MGLEWSGTREGVHRGCPQGVHNGPIGGPRGVHRGHKYVSVTRTENACGILMTSKGDHRGSIGPIRGSIGGTIGGP